MKVTSKTSTKAILAGIKKLFQKEEWVQGLYKEEKENGKICYCLVGGVREVCGVDSMTENSSRPFQRAMKALASVIPKKYHTNSNGEAMDADDIVITYNDDDDRTVGQVMKSIDKAIKKA